MSRKGWRRTGREDRGEGGRGRKGVKGVVERRERPETFKWMEGGSGRRVGEGGH